MFHLVVKSDNSLARVLINLLGVLLLSHANLAIAQGAKNSDIQQSNNSEFTSENTVGETNSELFNSANSEFINSADEEIESPDFSNEQRGETSELKVEPQTDIALKQQAANNTVSYEEKPDHKSEPSLNHILPEQDEMLLNDEAIVNRQEFRDYFAKETSGRAEAVYMVHMAKASIFVAPDETSQVVTILHQGELIHVLEKRDEWLRVGLREWVRLAHVQHLKIKTLGLAPIDEADMVEALDH